MVFPQFHPPCNCSDSFYVCHSHHNCNSGSVLICTTDDTVHIYHFSSNPPSYGGCRPPIYVWLLQTWVFLSLCCDVEVEVEVEVLHLLSLRSTLCYHELCGTNLLPPFLLFAFPSQEGMMAFVKEAVGGADVLLFVTDIFEEEFPSEEARRRFTLFRLPHFFYFFSLFLVPSRLLSLLPGLAACLVFIYLFLLPGVKHL
ncbi:unnamed protein product [Discosporangium mesarthrocarpum]